MLRVYTFWCKLSKYSRSMGKANNGRAKQFDGDIAHLGVPSLCLWLSVAVDSYLLSCGIWPDALLYLVSTLRLRVLTT